MKIIDKIKRTLKLAKSKVKGKDYTSLQQPVQDMSYKEAYKEFSKKKQIIFAHENNFNDRNKELIKKVIFESRDNDFAINSFLKILSDKNISKGVKIDFIHQFGNFFDDNELCHILSLDNEKIDEQFKIQLIREVGDRVPEEFSIMYFDYTNIGFEYIEKIIKNMSVNAKIVILNRLKNGEMKEKLLIKEVSSLDFEEAKKLYEQVILYGFREIEDFYVERIKVLNSDSALKMMNELNYISPKVARAFDKVIKLNNVEEVIDYINNNDVNKGGMIYLNRKFNFTNKKKVFDSIKDVENKKKALAIFMDELSKREFFKMVENEENEIIRYALKDNALSLIKDKNLTESDLERIREL